MKIIYLKKTRRDIHITLKEKHLFKRKYIDNNSGTLQKIFWDGAGLKEELLDIHNTGTVIELTGKHRTEAANPRLQLRQKDFSLEWNNPILNFNWSEVEFTKFSQQGHPYLENLK